MMEKFDDILQQYSKELQQIANLFEKNRGKPPVYKSYPPIAGAIQWAASLFESAKGPIIQFSHAGLLTSEHGEAVSSTL